MIEIVTALIYYLKEIISPNLDLFYILSIILIIKSLIDKEEAGALLKSFVWIYPIILYALIQVLVIDNINLLRLCANISKIFICIFLFKYVQLNFHKLNIIKTILIISTMFILSLPIAFINKNGALWRLNDIVNKYSETRLQLFYFEPSELAYQVAVIIIFSIYIFFISSKSYKLIFTIIIIFLSYILLLTKSMGALGCLVIALIVTYIYKLYRNRNFKQLYIGLIILCLVSISIWLFINSNLELALRARAILNGNDASTRYRLVIGFNTMKQILVDTNFIGVGFGNFNTEENLYFYSSLGIVTRIANSFMYFIAENGVFGVLFEIYILFYLIKNVNRKDSLKICLLIFSIIYQIPGGYFTNPMNWILYGIITNKFMIPDSIRSVD